MTVTVQPATSQTDLRDVGTVLDKVFGIAPPAAILRVGYMFDLLRSDQLVLLARSGDQPIGAAVCLRGRAHAELTHMAVQPDFQGRGVGRRLFTATCAWAEEAGYSEVRWSVSPTNVAAVAAYLAWGARMTGWIDNAYGVDGDAYNRGETHRFRGEWRSPWPSQPTDPIEVAHADLDGLRSAVRHGAEVVGCTAQSYVLARP